ncbi:MAG TPA: hypothetical protein ENJ26_04525 [Rhodobacteraceae bacterium]|nr:hypothetical protein [Paracoccaceae bacterium]
MSDVHELEKRLSAALDRIAKGLSAVAPVAAGAPDPAELERLRETLETERNANAQLEQRVLAIKEKQEKLVASMEAEVNRLRAEVEQQEAAVQKMKRVNKRLRENNRALREANRQGVADPELINNSMVAELDALRASRESDRAELDMILSELKPLVEGGANA